jgi:hypothetical protein
MTFDKNGSGIRAGRSGPDPSRGACARIVLRGPGRYGCAPAAAPAAGGVVAPLALPAAGGTCK